MRDKTLADPEQFSGQIADSRALDALTDRELLKRFAQRHEEGAFAALVRRHGPMVLSVCQRVLRHSFLSGLGAAVSIASDSKVSNGACPCSSSP